MIDILYPFKMDNLSEAYSSMYEALNPKLQAIQDKAQADVKKRAAEKQATEKRTSAFQDYKKQQTERGAKPHEVLDGWKGGKGQIGPMKKEGRYRAEWEQLKLMERDDYRQAFDTWIENLSEEGYDIDRWSDEELVETFITESDLWGSRDAVLEALLSEVGELNEEDKKGKGSGTKDACYHKVKARYSVWPSAYASGALVKCRKKGAKNWGNSSKKEEVDYSIDEIYQGKHGQTEKQYQDSRSDAGKMISGDSKGSGAGYSSRSMRGTGPNPAGGSKKPEGQGRMTSGARTDLQFRKVALKKKEAEKKEAMKTEEFVDEGWAAAAKIGMKTLGKQAVRQGIKYGGKTGGKIVKNVIKHGGDELKNQAIQTAGDVAVNTVKKIGNKTRQKITPNDDVQEAVQNQAAEKSAERQVMRKLKQQNKMKQVIANRIITKDNEQDAKLQKKLAKIQMSSFSNWRDELELIDENRMTAYNAGAGEGMEDRGISKSLADKMGRSNDESAFSRRKTSGKFNKDYNKNILKDKKPRSNTTGRGTPTNYRKGYEDRDMGRYQSKIVQGKGSIKDLGKKK